MSLLRNIATVGGATAISRVLGFARDVLIAAALGTGPVAEAFFVAQRLPNLFRRLFAEGAFQSAFVPLYARKLEAEGDDSAKRFADESLAALAFSLLVFTVLAELCMVWLTLALAPGFAGDPAKFDLTVHLSRIAFPYLALVSIVSLYSGVLNGHGRFSAAAFSPSILNLVMIFGLAYVYLSGEIETPYGGLVASAAITLGGVAQLLALSWSLKRAGITLHWKRPRWTANVKRLLQLAGPSVVAGGVVQINVIVGTIIASTQAGAISWLYYADRLYQLPLGIVGIAIGVVLLPDLARSLRAGRLDIARHTQNRSIEFAAALTLPASVALFMIPAPLIGILFERGAFTAADTAATAPALAAYAVGLPAFVAIKVLQPGYFAREDTKTPMIYGAISMVVNVVAALALFPVAGHVGIAAATSIAAWINVATLIWTLRKREQLIADSALKRRLPLLGLASIVMGLTLWGAMFLLGPYFADERTTVRVIVLGILVGGGFTVFVAFSHAIGAIDLKALYAGLRKKAPPPPPPGD